MDNIITAVFGATRTARTHPRYQWDYGQYIEFAGAIDIPRIFETHFANEGEEVAVRYISDGSPVPVPDELFISGKDIKVWVYTHTSGTDGETVYTATIPVIERAKPEEYEPTPSEADLIAQTIAVLNRDMDAVEAAYQNALDAQAAQTAAEAAQTAAEQAAINSSHSAEEAAQNAAEGVRDAVSDILASVQASEASAAASAASAESAARTVAEDARSAIDDILAEVQQSEANAAASAETASEMLSAATEARERAEAAAAIAEEYGVSMRMDGTTLIFTSSKEG